MNTRELVQEQIKLLRLTEMGHYIFCVYELYVISEITSAWHNMLESALFAARPWEFFFLEIAVCSDM